MELPPIWTENCSTSGKDFEYISKQSQLAHNLNGVFVIYLFSILPQSFQYNMLHRFIVDRVIMELDCCKNKNKVLDFLSHKGRVYFP